MPLQGISAQSKVDLLKAVAEEKLSLKEMTARATNIKKTKELSSIIS
jgi:hypothetical protein